MDRPARVDARQQIVGYVLAVACLIWVFHDIELDRMLHQIGSVTWWWIPGAVACDIASYYCQGAQWQLMLKPVGMLPAMRATQAIYVGLFTNEVLPMRLGEIVRAYLVSRWLSQPVAAVVPSILLGRLLDGVWLAIAVAMTAMLAPLPAWILQAADIVGILVLAGVAILLVLAWRGSKRLPRSLLDRIIVGLSDLGRAGILWRASLYAAGFLTLQGLAFWFIMCAYRLALPAASVLAVFLIVRLGTAIPNAPANVGSFQFAAVLGLSMFGVEKTRAVGFSIGAFLVLTLPLWALGFLALSRSGMTFSSIRRDLRGVYQW